MGRRHNPVRAPLGRTTLQRLGVSFFFVTLLLSIPALVKKVTEGNYEMSSKAWEGVSQEARDLIRLLLDVDPNNRLSPQEVLQHPWMALSFH